MCNGTGKIIKTRNIDFTLYTDASGLGFGCYVNDSQEYCFGTWDACYLSNCTHVEPSPTFDSITGSISQRELWPILIMCKRLSSSLKGCHVCVNTDNESVQSMINTGRSKEINAMSMLREIFWIRFVYNFTLTSRYVKGIDNVRADFLSRVGGFTHTFLLFNRLFMSLFSCCRKAILASILE